MASEPHSIFIPKVSSADLAAIDFFTWQDAVLPQAPEPHAVQRNNHGLLAFPDTGSNSVYFPGVIGKDWGESFISLDIFWAAPLTVGNVVWFVSWERDSALPLSVNLDVDSYGPEKSVLSVAPPVSGELRKASLVFTQAEADGLAAGDPFRLRLRRDGDEILDTLTGDAQFFRLYYQGLP